MPRFLSLTRTPPTKQQKRYLHCLVPFLKDSPGTSFQEKNQIDSGTRTKGKNVGRAMQSTVNIHNKRPLYDSVCLDVEMNCCEHKEPLGPLKGNVLTLRLGNRESRILSLLLLPFNVMELNSVLSESLFHEAEKIFI